MLTERLITQPSEAPTESKHPEIITLKEEEFESLSRKLGGLNEELHDFCNGLLQKLSQLEKEKEKREEDDFLESDFTLEKKHNKIKLHTETQQSVNKYSQVLQFLSPVRDTKKFMQQPLYRYWLNTTNQLSAYNKTTNLNRKSSWELYSVLAKAIFNIKGILPSTWLRCFNMHPGYDAVDLLERIQKLLEKHFPEFPQQWLDQDVKQQDVKAARLKN